MCPKFSGSEMIYLDGLKGSRLSGRRRLELKMELKVGLKQNDKFANVRRRTKVHDISNTDGLGEVISPNVVLYDCVLAVILDLSQRGEE